MLQKCWSWFECQNWRNGGERERENFYWVVTFKFWNWKCWGGSIMMQLDVKVEKFFEATPFQKNIDNDISSEWIDVGQWLWLSWLSGRFRCQRSTVRIQSLANFHIGHSFVFSPLYWKDENKDKEAGNGPFFQLGVNWCGGGGHIAQWIYLHHQSFISWVWIPSTRSILYSWFIWLILLVILVLPNEGGSHFKMSVYISLPGWYTN